MTTLLLVFAAGLLLAVLLSNLAKRTILSTAMIFLVAGHADRRCNEAHPCIPSVNRSCRGWALLLGFPRRNDSSTSAPATTTPASTANRSTGNHARELQALGYKVTLEPAA